MITVGVSGAAGRMGSLVAETISAAEDLALGPLYDPSPAAGPGIESEPRRLAEADVVVEFTRPDVVMANLRLWHELGIHAVVGTSGFDETRLDTLRKEWGDGPSNCLIVPNFSIGAVLMARFAEMAAPHFAAAEVIELHHDHKADAPSGTALETARRIGAAAPDQRRAVESVEMVAGVRGGVVDAVRVHSVRLPGLLAHQEVLLGGAGEILTIKSDTTDRIAFMPGVLLAVRSVATLPQPVTVGLEPLLGV